MDTFSHALWGYGLFGYKRYALLAIFFGAFPDLISLGAYMVIKIINTGTLERGAPAIAAIPDWVFTHYAFGHSFVTSITCVSLVALFNKRIAFAMLAWPFHIVLDFPFHSLDYFPTPIFWPISDFKVDGISWGNWFIWFPNVGALIALLVYRHQQKKRRVG